MKIEIRNSGLRLFLLGSLSIALTGCRTESPIDFHVAVPSIEHVTFQATLKQRIGLGIEGSFPIADLGVIQLTPEASNTGFGLAFDLQTRSFLRQTWLDFNEVNALPTGAAFPANLVGPLVELSYPELNSAAIDWKFYVGVRGKAIVGAVALIKSIGADFPKVIIGQTFYDQAGRAVLSAQFFPPRVDATGAIAAYGGIFVGTDLSAFLPASFRTNAVMGPPMSASSPQGPLRTLRQSVMPSEMRAAAVTDAQATEFQPILETGHGRYGFISAEGPDAADYATPESMQALADLYLEASRGPAQPSLSQF